MNMGTISCNSYYLLLIERKLSIPAMLHFSGVPVSAPFTHDILKSATSTNCFLLLFQTYKRHECRLERSLLPLFLLYAVPPRAFQLVRWASSAKAKRLSAALAEAQISSRPADLITTLLTRVQGGTSCLRKSWSVRIPYLGFTGRLGGDTVL